MIFSCSSCLVNLAVIGRFYKGHLLNCLENMISGETNKFGNSPLLFDMVPRSSPFRMPQVALSVAKVQSMVSGKIHSRVELYWTVLLLNIWLNILTDLTSDRFNRSSVSGVINFSSVEIIDAKFDPNDFITEEQ